MTDQINQFRGPLKCSKGKLAIQVGGGILWSKMSGTVEVVAEDGSSCLLKRCMYVPGLGISLVSARRFCKDGIVGLHDSRNMYFKRIRNSMKFKKDDKTILHAYQNNGLYVLKSIFTENIERALVAHSETDRLPIRKYVKPQSSLEHI